MSYFDLKSKITRGESLSPKDQAIFLKRLSVMVKSGFPLPKALSIISKEESCHFRTVLCDIKEQVASGKSFSESLSSHSSFLPALCQKVLEGKEGESFKRALPLLIEHTERDRRFSKDISEYFFKSSLPLFIAVILGFLILSAVYFYFGGSVNLPAITELILSSLYSLAEKGSYLILIGIFLLFFVSFLAKIKFVKTVMDEAICRTPIISTLLAKKNAVTINRRLSTLISSGIPLNSALRITADHTENLHYKRLLRELADRVDNGEDFSSSFGLCLGLYPGAVMREMIGDKSPEAFNKLADIYERDIKNIAKSVFQIAEISLMIFVGAGLALFLISVVQPMLID